MRRFLLWHLPITASLVAVGLFGFGFVQFLRGNTGVPVDFVAARPAPVAARGTIAPIILGDSLARGAGDESGLGISGRLDDELKGRKLAARKTYNLGVNGARTADLLRQLETPNVRTMLAESNVIVVSIGGNDLWGGNDWRSVATADADARMDDVLARIESAIASIRSANPRARIFFLGLYNPFVSTPEGKALSALVNRWNARLVERFSNDPDLAIVATSDLFSHRDRLAIDRFHPGGEGYGLIARRIADAL